VLTCTLLGEVGPTTPRAQAAIRSILRTLIFIPGAAMALSATATGGYFGINGVLLLLWFSLVPGALLCWILAAWQDDRWTAVYAAAWVVVLIVLPQLFSFLDILH